MLEEKDESSLFKVVDRRSFAADGSKRESVPEETRTPTETPRTESRVREPEGEFGPGEDELSGFDTLVSYLGTTAMFQLGLMAGPGGERIPPDLPNARRTIEMLEVLEQKTRGNLTGSEIRLLEDVLYELRMGFVEVEKRGTARKK
jgi:hypothetical protein